MSAAPQTAREGQAALIEAITEAVHDGDDRTVRRLLARFAELATVADLHVLRDALPLRPAQAQAAPPEPTRGTARPGAHDDPTPDTAARGALVLPGRDGGAGARPVDGLRHGAGAGRYPA
ncbi:hypothetical protein AB0K51_12815 [Kitasatospora sp. NPDC049285]|uniref:hypothetical protein n=1 Tax=Kitasatospora sp. NPDC049285 TaxID=3157096 RepID=UPI00341BF038